MKIYSNNNDITDTVSKCILETHIDGCSDKLTIQTDVKINDTIILEKNSIKSGTMYPALFRKSETIAYAIKPSMFVEHSRWWTNCSLYQLLLQIAASNSLELKVYGFKNVYYAFMKQESSDIEFAQKLADYEGYNLTIYDDEMIVVSDIELLARNPIYHTLNDEDDFEITEEPFNYDGIEIITESGTVNKQLNGATGSRFYSHRPKLPTDLDTASRWLDGVHRKLMMKQNYGTLTSYVVPDCVAGSVLIINDNNTERRFIVNATRHDMMSDKKKIFLRGID